MKTKVIRTVEELENLRVSLSNEIEVLLQTGQDVQTLDKIKALRKALGEIRDELTIAKNIEANKVKESLLNEVRSVEAEASNFYGKMLSLGNEVLPTLKQDEPLINQIAENNWKRASLNTQLDALKQRWQETYNETLDVRQPMVGLGWSGWWMPW